MKAKLLEAVQDAPSAESVEPEELQRYYAKFDESFFTFCEKGKCVHSTHSTITITFYDFH